VSASSLIAERPGSGPARPWRFPSFTRLRLDSGLEVLLCDLPGRPIAAARLVLEAGAVTEPAGRSGIAIVAARSLTEGTAALDAHALAERMETLGAEIRGELSWDSMHIRMDVPSSRLAPALELLGEIARLPGFREADVDRIRDERLDQLAQERVDPSALAARAFGPAVFVPTAPTPAPSRATRPGWAGSTRPQCRPGTPSGWPRAPRPWCWWGTCRGSTCRGWRPRRSARGPPRRRQP